MKLTTRNIIAVVFVVISLFSLTFILVEGWNYSNYYWEARAAILDPETNNTVVRGVAVARDPNSGLLTIQINASATNPTGYKGLTLSQFAIILFFFHTGNISASIFTPSANNLLANASPKEALDPQSTINSNLIVNLNSTQTSQLQAFRQNYNGDVEAHVLMITSVNSFFDPVFGVMTTTKEQILPIVWS
jgi:hypothetical protein